MPRVRRGINIGNALDATASERRRFAVEVSHLDVVRRAGFDTVRLPVAWSKHASRQAPFDIDSAFVTTVDELVHGAVERQLDVIVDMHHYDELSADPAAHHDRFLGLWTHIAEHYAALPATVRFELLNEPHDQLFGQRWNDVLAETVSVVRASNPDRELVVGPAMMNTIAGLDDLELPDDDRLVVAIHYYLPLPFTHQGADWWPGAADWVGTRWGSSSERDAVRHDLGVAAAWARRRELRLLVGEFGVIERAATDDRVAWTAHVRATADEYDMPWCYWELATDFSVYDPASQSWNERLRDALLAT